MTIELPLILPRKSALFASGSRFGSVEPLHKRIMLVSDAPPHTCGPTTTFFETERRLKNRGYQVDTLILDQFVTLPSLVHPTLRFALPFWPTGNNKTARQRLHQETPDRLVVMTEGPLGWSAARAAKLLKMPFATFYTTDWPMLVQRFTNWPGPIGSWLHDATNAVIRSFHHQADAILANTPSSRDKLAQHGYQPDKLKIVGRGVDTDKFNLSHFDPAWRAQLAAQGHKAPYFLYVGRVSNEKRLDDFLSVDLNNLDGQPIGGTKIIVGDGPALPHLKATYGNRSDTVFMGELKGKALQTAFASSDVFVFPSDFDTFGVVLIEAAASGLPVAAYPVMGPIDVIRNNTSLGAVGALDRSLAKAMRQAHTLSKESGIRERCHAYAKTEYSWDSYLDRLLSHVPIIGQPKKHPHVGHNNLLILPGLDASRQLKL